MAVWHLYRLLWVTTFVFVIVPYVTLGLLSDYKICGDSDCESPMSRVQAIRDHHGRDCRFLSFRQGDIISVYHKLTGRREDLWAGTIDKKFGYFPKDAVQEEQIYETREKVLETHRSDFFCMDEYGYPIDTTEMDSDDDNDKNEIEKKIQIQDFDSTQTVADSANVKSSSLLADPLTEFPVSAQRADGTTAEGYEKKNAADAASGTHKEKHNNPSALNEQGGSPPASWLGSTVTGWLGLEKKEESVDLSVEVKDDEKKETQGKTLTSSLTGWLGFGREEKPDDTEDVKSRDEDKGMAGSFTSTVTSWLGFGEKMESDQDGNREMEKENEAVKFRSRRMSLDLEGSQLQEGEKKEMGTLDWLGNRVSHTLGFGIKAEETIKEEKEQAASSSWLGIVDIFGRGKDRGDADASSVSDLKDNTLQQETPETKNIESSQTEREEEKTELAVQRTEEEHEFATIPKSGNDTSSSSNKGADESNAEEQMETEAESATFVLADNNSGDNTGAVFTVNQKDISSQTDASGEKSSSVHEDRSTETESEEHLVPIAIENDNSIKSIGDEYNSAKKTKTDVFTREFRSVELNSESPGQSVDKGETHQLESKAMCLEGEELAEIPGGGGHEGVGYAVDTDVLCTYISTTLTVGPGQGNGNTEESSGISQPCLSAAKAEERNDQRLTSNNSETPTVTPDNSRETDTHNEVQRGDGSTHRFQVFTSITRKVSWLEKAPEEESKAQVENSGDQKSVSPQRVAKGKGDASFRHIQKETDKYTGNNLQQAPSGPERAALIRSAFIEAVGSEEETGVSQEVEESNEKQKQTEAKQHVNQAGLKEVEKRDDVEKEPNVTEEENVKQQVVEEIGEEGEQEAVMEVKVELQAARALKEEENQEKMEAMKENEKHEEDQELKAEENGNNEKVGKFKVDKKQEEMNELEEEDIQGKVEVLEAMERQQEVKRDGVVELKEEKEDENSKKVEEIKEETEEVKEIEIHENIKDEENQGNIGMLNGEPQQEEDNTEEEDKRREMEEIEENDKQGEVKGQEKMEENGENKKERVEKREEVEGEDREGRQEEGSGSKEEEKQNEVFKFTEDKQENVEVATLLTDEKRKEMEEKDIKEDEKREEQCVEELEVTGKQGMGEFVAKEEKRLEEVEELMVKEKREMKMEVFKEEEKLEKTEKGKQEEVEEIKEEEMQKELGEVKEKEKRGAVEKLKEEGKGEEVKEEKHEDEEVLKEERKQENEEEVKEERKRQNEEEVKEERKREDEEVLNEKGKGEEVKEEKKQEGEEVLKDEGKGEEEKEKKQEGELELKVEGKGEEVKDEKHEDEEEVKEERKRENEEEVKEERKREDEEVLNEKGKGEEEKEEKKQEGEEVLKEEGKGEEVEEKQREDEEELKEEDMQKQLLKVEQLHEETRQEDVEQKERQIQEEGKQVEEKSQPEKVEEMEERQMEMDEVKEVEEDENCSSSADEERIQREEQNHHMGEGGVVTDRREDTDLPFAASHGQTDENRDDGHLHPGDAPLTDPSDDKVFHRGNNTEPEHTDTSSYGKPEQRHSHHNTDVDVNGNDLEETIESQTLISEHKDSPGPSPLSDDLRTKTAEAESGKAFGLFKNVLSFYTQTSAAETEDFVGSDRSSQTDVRELDSNSDSEQLPMPPHTPPPQTEIPPQTKTLSKLYKNLASHIGEDEEAILTELFGQHKLQFLDYMLGSSEAGPDNESDTDESILSDIERLLRNHKARLAAPSGTVTDAQQDDKEKTTTLAALQKLEMLITRVRESFSPIESDTRGNYQAEASSVSASCSTHSKDREMNTEEDLNKAEDPPAQSNNMQRAERTDVTTDEHEGRKEKETADVERESDEGCGAPASHTHHQLGPPLPLEGVMEQILHAVHQIAEESATHIHTVRELLIWTVEAVSSLPDDIRPGPDLYGVPWEPAIITCLIGVVTVLLFMCRCYRSVKSRMYRNKEQWMAAQVEQLLDEKCKVLDSLSKCQQEYDELEDSLRDSGVLAQTEKIEQLEVKATQLAHTKTELERDLKQLKDQLDQQKEHRIEQERRITELEESMKTTEDETKDLQSQEEQTQTTMKVYAMNSDRLQRNLEAAGEENTLLQESNTQLKQQLEDWAERVSELDVEMQRCEATYSGMQQDVANKDERILSLTDCLLRMKAWDSDLEEEEGEEGARKTTSSRAPGKEQKNGSGEGKGTEDHFQKVQKLIYAAKLNADLKSVDEDKDRVFAKLNDEVKAKEDLQESIQELEKERLALQSDAEHYSDQVRRLQQKLQIMTEMYQENELKLHRLLTVEEKERLQKEEKLNKADKNIALAMEELNNYRQRAEEMEEELEKTKQSYQTQISAHEKKAHNNWLAARAAERDLSDIRRENALLRQKLTDTQFKLDSLDKDPYALDTLARPLPFRGERSPYGPSPLGRPASETRPFLSPPTLMDGPPARLSPRASRGLIEPPSGQGEVDRSGGPHSDSGSNSPTWERVRRGPLPGPPVPSGPLGPPGYMFPEAGGPMYRRPPPPPGALGLLPPPGSLPPGPLPSHLRGFPHAGPPGPPHPADMADGTYRERSLGPGELGHRESGPGDGRTPPEADPRVGGPPPPGPPVVPIDGSFPRRLPYGPPPPDFYPPRGPEGPPMIPRWATPHPGMMFPSRFPPGGPPLPPGPHPHHAPLMRPPLPNSLPPPSMVPPPPQLSLPSLPHSQSPEEHRPSPEDAI